jgi:hypothetical protein
VYYLSRERGLAQASHTHDRHSLFRMQGARESVNVGVSPNKARGPRRQIKRRPVERLETGEGVGETRQHQLVDRLGLREVFQLVGAQITHCHVFG